MANDGFGGLFDKVMAPPKAAVAPLTVSQVNQRAKTALERQLGHVTVIGEISQPKLSSGHLWFALKDNASQLPCVMFRRDLSRLKFQLEHGMEVVVTGRLTVYGAYGRYQMVVDSAEPRGQGALQAAYEQLKSKLQNEGLFEQGRKRALPALPGRVAVVTSATGAVIRDIINVSTRRFPQAQILLIPARVQGPDSAGSILDGIKRVSAGAEKLGLSALIVGRGGGSLEDLWGFNDERVARAIVECPIPVVSAVGHETDFTIADFVADVRAPTPSAAAELIFTQRSELLQRLGSPVQRARLSMKRSLNQRRQTLRMFEAKLGDGRSLLREAMQRLAYARDALPAVLRADISRREKLLNALTLRLRAHDPKVSLSRTRTSLVASTGRIQPALRRRLALERTRIENLQNRLEQSMSRRVEQERMRLALAGRRLDALSPLSILDRGYAIALNASGQAVKDAESLQHGDKLSLRLAHGTRQVIVEDLA
jgi:exodeoxyribonuclease VII large subunit